MKRPVRFWRWISILAVLGIFLFVAFRHRSSPICLAQELPSENLLKNAGFEESRTSPPEFWGVDPEGAVKGQIQVVANASSNGNTLQLLPNARNTGGNRPLAVVQNIPAAQFRGRTIRLSAEMKAEGAASAVAMVIPLRQNGSQEDVALLRRTADGDGFARQETTLQLSNQVGAFLVVLLAEGTSGTVYFNNVYAGLPAKNDLASGPLKAEATIAEAAEIRDLPDDLFGTNIEWIGDGNSAWNAQTRRLDNRLIEFTRDLGFSLIRFPGGVFSDFYHWRDGVGPIDARPTTPHYQEGPSSRHNFGTGELLDFANQTGARLLITVNAGTGTPEEAADWVRYLKGRTGVPGIAFWEVGNELYIRDEHPSSKYVTIPPGVYADRLIQFSRAIKQIDPQAKVGAIGGSNFGSYALVGYPNWNQEVLSRAAGDIDFLAVHNGYAPVLIAETRKLDVRTVYAAMLAAPLAMGKNLETLTGEIQRYAGGRGSAIRLAVTEWGPFFHVLPTSSWVDHNKTLASALYTASVLKQFAEAKQLGAATSFKLSDNAAFMGWIGRRNGEWRPNAQSLAFQLYSRNFGEIVVRSAVTSPTYNSQKVGLIDSVSGVPYVEVVASRSRNRRKLRWIAINKHFDQSIETTFRFEGRVPSGIWRTRTLSGTAIDAHTGTELPNVAGLNWAKQETAPGKSSFYSTSDREVTLVESVWNSLPTRGTYKLPAFSVTAFEADLR